MFLARTAPGVARIAERREMAVIRDSLVQLGARVRWVPHGRMPADVMTKVDPSKGNLAMIELLRKGTISLIVEGGHLSERALNVSLKSRSRGACLRALQEEDLVQKLEPTKIGSAVPRSGQPP